MSYLIYFIITIGILVFVHELGHFLAAKACRIRTDVFAIGFGKRLFGWNMINGFTFGDLPDGFDLKGHTDYRISLLPLGGYVKIAGMVDESFDTEFANKIPEKWEFRSKNTFQKLFVISAGVLMNFFLTLLIFWGVFFYRGEKVWKTSEIGPLPIESVAAKAGFQEGDIIKSINGKKPEIWSDVLTSFSDVLSTSYNVAIIRDSVEVNLLLNKENITDEEGRLMYLPAAPSNVAILKVIKNSPAEEGGIEEGDMFISINDVNISSVDGAQKIIKANPDTELSIKLQRNSDTLLVQAKPDIQGLLGIQLMNAYNGPFEYRTFGFIESFENSFLYMVRIVELTGYFVKRVVQGDVEFGDVFGGPVRIAQYAVKSADSGLIEFLNFLAQLSLSLAIINILPFPALDGGHFIIILIEGIMRRELPLKVKIAVQNVGFIILLMLMAFIIYTDIIKSL